MRVYTRLFLYSSEYRALNALSKHPGFGYRRQYLLIAAQAYSHNILICIYSKNLFVTIKLASTLTRSGYETIVQEQQRVNHCRMSL